MQIASAIEQHEQTAISQATRALMTSDGGRYTFDGTSALNVLTL